MWITAPLILLGGSSASSVAEHAAAAGGLHLPVSRYQRVVPLVEVNDIGQLIRRDSDSVSSVLRNNQSFYSIDLEIGSPLQPISLLLDTGSSDVWVFDKSACIGTTTCEPGSIFDSSASSSFKRNDTELLQRYADGSVALGRWAQDNMQLGDAKISNFNFAVANISNATQGVAGIGLPVGEAPYVLGDIKRPYANLPEQLKQEGVIQQMAYSMWLSSKSTKAGSVLFGAIDHAKYVGDLYRMALVPTDGYSHVSRFAVPLTGLSTFDSNGVEKPFAAINIPAVLDSGSTMGLVPINYVRQFFWAIGARRYSDNIYLVECDKFSNKDGGLGLQIGGIDITVGFDDLLTVAARERVSGKEYCVPGFLVTDDSSSPETIAIIGDNILRTLYVVYDLENLEVAVAAAATGKSASSSSIEVLSTGIPGTPLEFNNTRATGTGTRRPWATAEVSMFLSASSSKGATPSTSLFASKTGEIRVPTAVEETIFIGAKTNFVSQSSRSKAPSASGASSDASSSAAASGASSSKKSKNSAAGTGVTSLVASIAALLLHLL